MGFLMVYKPLGGAVGGRKNWMAMVTIARVGIRLPL